MNDVCIHPNQGELISCDQAGSIKQWDLTDNICSHELVGPTTTVSVKGALIISFKTPAGDIPIRSITLASDGSCLVAGNNKVSKFLLSDISELSSFVGTVLCLEIE